ncbi:MAG: hypothetical protein Q7T82_07550 [Armatimonadota bacterium]|nr:hypothetical protein [Armatimonadota bacterium]
MSHRLVVSILVVGVLTGMATGVVTERSFTKSSVASARRKAEITADM